ncbi:DUF6965 family protein [Pedobacter africanus]|uniref:DUF6965 domain-containing protein n=1 Tax=Pedobacter africanus TaxID=151894 RepID=A0A1W2CWX6_9SPHI|nr:hypothetical protein [Pedobacter africanus]SMC89749.1 hypothetical protein SAMN04488524_3356 [Pedobacter africanus]
MTPEQVEDLANRLHGLQLPEAPFELYPGTTIIDIERFIATQLTALRHAPEARTSQPAAWRLERFLELVEAAQ